MKRDTCSWRLKPKVDSDGKIVIKSDNVVMGLMIKLLNGE
jgi:hypothetical protein